tara:strand:+ start:45461 stop:45874 length:414 start_codon:yes stop_codon:yes gene_type:complete
MAKLSRKMLKSLVKECLVEILSEGIGENKIKKSHLREQKQLELENQHLRRTQALDNIKFEKKVQSTVGQITDDPVMASILADTAVTTLQEQTSAESYPGMSSQMMGSGPGPSGESLDAFGDVAGNWATLAFAEKKLP